MCGNQFVEHIPGDGFEVIEQPFTFTGSETVPPAQNMVLAAWELGIGSAPATVYEHDLVVEQLGLPPDQHCEFILSFGHPADPAALTAPRQAGGRMRLDEVVHFERW